MNHFRDQKGIALATALLLTLIAMVVVMTTIYFVTQGTRMSGIQKRYHTALEASHGALDAFARYVFPNLIVNTNNPAAGFTIDQFKTNHPLLFPASAPGPYVTTSACLRQKVMLTSDLWTQCVTTDLLNPKANWDLKMTLKSEGGQPDYDVYVKVVDTMIGNSDTSGGGESLIGQGVVDPGILTPQHYPYVYRIEMQGERQQNPDERANLSVLYAY